MYFWKLCQISWPLIMIALLHADITLNKDAFKFLTSSPYTPDIFLLFSYYFVSFAYILIWYCNGYWFSIFIPLPSPKVLNRDNHNFIRLHASLCFDLTLHHLRSKVRVWQVKFGWFNYCMLKMYKDTNITDTNIQSKVVRRVFLTFTVILPYCENIPSA